MDVQTLAPLAAWRQAVHVADLFFQVRKAQEIKPLPVRAHLARGCVAGARSLKSVFSLNLGVVCMSTFVSAPSPASVCIGPSPATADAVLQDTLRWLERAVIGLNLCPFAKAVHVKGQIHCVVSSATEPEALLQELERELAALVDAAPEVRDTTLLVAPTFLPDFLDFNAFLPRANKLLRKLKLQGELQIASFHPQFQFAGTSADDVTNCTNRAPYPTLHLLREASIDRAVEVFPDAEDIFERNMHLLEDLGMKGWRALDVGAHSQGAVSADADANTQPATLPASENKTA